MADRNSAELFGDIFGILADIERGKSVDPRRLALKFWKKSRDYDFSPYQMDAERNLSVLGLARQRVDPEYPEDGRRWFYGVEGRDE